MILKTTNINLKTKTVYDYDVRGLIYFLYSVGFQYYRIEMKKSYENNFVSSKIRHT